ncbi:MAG: MBL fold metallo-hydrolase [Candidatus Aminicenantes bacterium]|nr:MBL fold metallo-hydrolase [Candidatus Aminicenantes bacterium]
MGIELSFLGTGGAVGTAERDNTSFVIRRKKALFLVECPGGVLPKLGRMDLDSKNVEGLFISHTHPDHVYGLPSFVHSHYDTPRTVPLFGSPETVEFCRGLLEYFHLFRDKILYRPELIPLTPSKPITVFEDLSVTAVPVPHASSSAAFLFNFIKEDMRLLYSGDTPPFSPLLKEAGRVDVLIHDCSFPSRFLAERPELKTMHTDALSLGRIASDAGVKILVPCHLFSDFGYSVGEIEEEIRRNYTGTLIIPSDMEMISLPGSFDECGEELKTP